jgi:hypothetical protein
MVAEHGGESQPYLGELEFNPADQSWVFVSKVAHKYNMINRERAEHCRISISPIAVDVTHNGEAASELHDQAATWAYHRLPSLTQKR